MSAMITYSPEADELLHAAHGVMLKVVAGRVRSPESTLWRWDAPDVAIVWNDREGVGRNLHVVLKDLASRSFLLEINAWKDYETPARYRKWRWEEDPRHYELDELGPAVADAFERVIAWTEDDLINKAELAGRPA